MLSRQPNKSDGMVSHAVCPIGYGFTSFVKMKKGIKERVRVLGL